jgi:NAD(P)-dependent dehydrogenase (short-subunit alcohol dehydrogenase family)
MKRALGTGGSGDIGGAICRRLAASGLEMVVHANRHLDAAERLVPMHRAGTPEEVADLVDYLVNGNTGYLSGQIISVNGAMA